MYPPHTFNIHVIKCFNKIIHYALFPIPIKSAFQLKITQVIQIIKQYMQKENYPDVSLHKISQDIMLNAHQLLLMVYFRVFQTTVRLSKNASSHEKNYSETG
jgi:hypothetical protein